MDYQTVQDESQLRQLCEAITRANVVGFDTEFVSEDTYYPHLCLVQVVVDGSLYLIDPIGLPDLTPFWEALATPGHVSVAHAGREELRFCLRAVNRRPAEFFDAQIAAGMVGMEYPAAYSTLISRIVGQRLGKGETRTDWRRRPLTSRQIEYALQDVIHLQPLYDKLNAMLIQRDRLPWLWAEMENWQLGIENADLQERWRRVSGISGLSPRQLGIVREIWRWRDQRARTDDRPPRRVLRDDLIVELARRESADPNRIRAIRGFERRNYQKIVDELAQRIQLAIDLPVDQQPGRGASARRPPMGLLGQFLSAALGALCRQHQLAPGLVGGAQDVRDLVSFRMGLIDGETPPPLATGWRAEVIGKSIDDLLQGRVLVGIRAALDEQPLEFVRR